MFKSTVVTKIGRASPEVIEGLRMAGVATVHEAGATRLLPPEIRPIQAGTRIAGSAITVSCGPGDNIMIHAAVEVIEPGDILVVTTASPSTNGMFGELLGVSVAGRGCQGLVIDAGVRDVADLREMGFPVWARVVHAAGTTKAVPGTVNLPVLCGRVPVNPGDVVVADDDGVILVAREEAAEIMESARRRLDKEAETRARLAAGELGLDLYGFRQRLTELGVRWIESSED